jgi:dihydrofolate synthase / folylpolyglutamate synthase
MTISAGVSLRRRLDELYRFERSGMRPGLAGVERLLELAGRPDRAFPSVLIAGTNGKGSTAAHLASILRAAGLRTGLYTSPHLVRFEERIRVDGAEIGSADLEALLAVWWPRFEEEKPSFFEAATALCFDHFAASRVDVAVVEVGLGGRLDATNVLVPEVSVITTISSDHTEILGHTLRSIAIEKAGIVKPGGRVAIGVAPGEARQAIEEIAAERGAAVVILGEDARARVVRTSFAGTEIELQTRSFQGTVRTPLPGAHQGRNAALAALAAELYLADRPEALVAAAIERGIPATRWPARAELLEGDPPVLVDGAHNVEGAAALAETVASLWPGRPVVFVAGFSRDKAHEAILRALGRTAARFVLTGFHGERAMPPDELLRVAPAGHLDCEAVPNPAEAIASAKAWARASGGAVVVTGSLYLIGEALPLLGAEVPRAL